MTNKGTTVYNNQLKNIAKYYIDEIIEEANLNPFFWQNISDKYNLKDLHFKYILDTQKAVLRTVALKRISCSFFISSTASGFFTPSVDKKKFNNDLRKYYLEDLFNLLDLIKEDTVDRSFKIPLPINLENKLNLIFDKNKSYIGFAPGAGEKNKIWPLENFLKVAKYFENRSYELVFFLGPLENDIKNKIIDIFPKVILPEDLINEFSGTEIVMATTKFLSCALTNDSGISHMLSTNYCPVVKLFGPKDANKFTPVSDKILTISSKEFGSKKLEDITIEHVIKKINELSN